MSNFTGQNWKIILNKVIKRNIRGYQILINKKCTYPMIINLKRNLHKDKIYISYTIHGITHVRLNKL